VTTRRGASVKKKASPDIEKKLLLLREKTGRQPRGTEKNAERGGFSEEIACSDPVSEGEASIKGESRSQERKMNKEGREKEFPELLLPVAISLWNRRACRWPRKSPKEMSPWEKDGGELKGT